MILAIGYRVRSPRGVQFRNYASTVLKEYLIKGFAMDDDRLKIWAAGLISRNSLTAFEIFVQAKSVLPSDFRLVFDLK